jgi:hypothetical protein
MPRLRHCLATRTSSSRPREAPCELCALTVFRDHELDVRVAIDRLEGLEIGLRQWIFETLSRTAERIVRQHRNNDADIITARATNGDL